MGILFLKEEMIMAHLEKMIRARRSCRDYTEEPLDRKSIGALIDQAVWVPNGSNRQPWSFVVVTDRSLMKHFSDLAKEGWLKTIDKNPYMKPYEEELKNPDNNVFYNAPSLVIIYGNAESYWYVYDCTMVAYNLILLAEESGLGSCWIGSAHNIFDDPSVKSEFGLSENWRLVAPIVLGHPAGTATGVNPRQPVTVRYFDGTEG
jgi:nitroreductase